MVHCPNHTHTVNWCSHWFEYFPNPPLNVLAMIENCLAHHDGQLLEHFIKHDITSHVRCVIYAYVPMLVQFVQSHACAAQFACWKVGVESIPVGNLGLKELLNCYMLMPQTLGGIPCKASVPQDMLSHPTLH